MINPGYQEKPAWFKNSFLDLREDVAEAAQSGKRVALFFYQDGCPYCKKLLEDNFGQKDISDLARTRFDFIAINLWGDREVTDLQGRQTTEKSFASQLKVQFTPTLLFLGEQGEVLLRVNGYYPPHKFKAALTWLAERRERQQSFLEYYGQQEPDKTSGRLHVEAGYLPAPLNLDVRQRKPVKPLLVLFEQKQCAQCDELHLDILRRPESKEQTARLDIALVDMWSTDPVVTPDGRQTTARQWARQLGIQHAPSLVFFDVTGLEVFRTEGYLKAFHIQSAMDYVASGAYKTQPSFQRYIAARADALEAKGVHIELMK